MSDQTNTEKTLSQQEIHVLRLEAQKELRKEISFMKTEKEYQELLADIEESKARRLRAIALQHQFLNPNIPSEPNHSKKERPEVDHEEPQTIPFPKNEKQTPVEAPVRKLKTE